VTAPRAQAGDSPAGTGPYPSGGGAPQLLRTAAVLAWLALVAQLVATALPGSRSGIETLIRRSDTAASVLSQAAVLLGSAELVLLVVATLAEHHLSLAYRAAIVPASSGVLMLVMLAMSMGLEAEANLAVAVAALLLAAAASAMAIRSPATRAQGLVLTAAAVACALKLFGRLLATGGAGPYLWVPGAPAIATAGYAFDAVAVLLCGGRFMAERRRSSRYFLPFVVALGLVLSWGALRGSLEGATTWQVVASRALAELVQGPLVAAALPSLYGIAALAVVLSGLIVLWPGSISVGALSAALVILARYGADVPASALVLSLGALAAPLGQPGDAREEGPAPRDVTVGGRPAGVDG